MCDNEKRSRAQRIRDIVEALEEKQKPWLIEKMETEGYELYATTWLPVVTFNIGSDPVVEGKCYIGIDPEDDVRIVIGDSIRFCNYLDREILIDFYSSDLFGEKIFAISPGACITLTTQKKGDFKFKVEGCNGTGGGGRNIIVHPPGAED